MRNFGVLAVFALLAAAGCVSVDNEARRARNDLAVGNFAYPLEWSEKLAQKSTYSKNWGLLEVGRVNMLAGDRDKALESFRMAIDSAVDRNESAPVLKLSDVGNTVLAATITDDRTREYYLSPYELNLALEYAILLQAMKGDLDSARVDSRLAVYVQDTLVSTYGADLEKNLANSKKGTSEVMEKENAAVMELMEGTRNSYENPLLWYLTGVMFEADEDESFEMALKSYQKAAVIKPDNEVFMRAASRTKRFDQNKGRLIVIYEDGIIPMRESIKVPVPVYTAMSIDIPSYRNHTASALPAKKTVDGKLLSLAVDVRALAYRDLQDQLPGVITRNITRAATQIAAQAAANNAGNGYVQLAVLAGNAVVSAIRRADTRSWVTLPNAQYVWEAEVEPSGEIAAGQTKIIWIHN